LGVGLLLLQRIRAGKQDDLRRDSASWVFVDIGFSPEGKTGGLLGHDGVPRELTIAQLRSELVALAQSGPAPMNLVLEAHLSAAFTAFGNPAGRLRDGERQERTPVLVCRSRLPGDLGGGPSAL